jgi:two-component system chemotaxis sensor kinase CheA
MKTDILIIESCCDLAQLGYVAMDRKPDNLYDFVIVVDDDNLLGVISIRKFLIEMSQAKEREIELLKTQKKFMQTASEKEKEYRLSVENMNKSLANKNSSIKNLLDNAGQGFFTIDSSLNISEDYSKECVIIFGCSIGNKNLYDLLNRYIPKS